MGGDLCGVSGKEKWGLFDARFFFILGHGLSLHSHLLVETAPNYTLRMYSKSVMAPQPGPLFSRETFFFGSWFWGGFFWYYYG